MNPFEIPIPPTASPSPILRSDSNGGLSGPQFNNDTIAEAEDAANTELRSSFQDFATNNRQFIDGQVASLSDNSLVTDAVKRSQGLGARTTARSNRASARSGLGMSPEQRESLKRLNQLGTSKGQVDSVNNARVDQQDRNTQVALNLSQQGDQLRSQGIGNLVDSAGLRSRRGRDFTLNRANQNAAGRNLATTAASAAFAAFV